MDDAKGAVITPKDRAIIIDRLQGLIWKLSVNEAMTADEEDYLLSALSLNDTAGEYD
jgi:hypothetical protein